MKKIAIFVTFITTLFTSGCFLKEKKLEQMLFPISLGLTYEENKYKAAKAVSDKMWKTYKLFGYDIQPGWTYLFTKLGRM